MRRQYLWLEYVGIMYFLIYIFLFVMYILVYSNIMLDVYSIVYQINLLDSI